VTIVTIVTIVTMVAVAILHEDEVITRCLLN
jgi:hypothetical protein